LDRSWQEPLCLDATNPAAGKTVIVSVFLYGAATVVSILSLVWLTWLALAVTGAADTVSTILRQTIRRFVTPDQPARRMGRCDHDLLYGRPQLGELEQDSSPAGSARLVSNHRWNRVRDRHDLDSGAGYGAAPL